MFSNESCPKSTAVPTPPSLAGYAQIQKIFFSKVNLHCRLAHRLREKRQLFLLPLQLWQNIYATDSHYPLWFFSQHTQVIQTWATAAQPFSLYQQGYLNPILSSFCSCNLSIANPPTSAASGSNPIRFVSLKANSWSLNFPPVLTTYLNSTRYEIIFQKCKHIYMQQKISAINTLRHAVHLGGKCSVLYVDPPQCYGKADFKERILLLNAFILPGVTSGLR